MPGPLPSTLQLIVLRHAKDARGENYKASILRAFQGGGSHEGGYLFGGGDLGFSVRSYDFAPSKAPPVQDLLDSALHTVTVALIDDHFLDDKSLIKWSERYWNCVAASEERHRFLPIPLHEKAGWELPERSRILGNSQYVRLHQLGEMAVRPVGVALLALHEARLCLVQGAGDLCPNLRFFISHAKADGLPLARSLSHLISQFPWLSDYYDARDVPAGAHWKKQLEKDVASSFLVLLHTDNFASRPWCQKEAILSDEYGAPGIRVEAQWGLEHEAENLPLGRLPSVRVGDGNLFRVLHLALRESVRAAAFRREVRELQRRGFLPDDAFLERMFMRPSIRALLRASKKLGGRSGRRVIIHPDPPLAEADREAAQWVIQSCSPGVELLTPTSIYLGIGGTP